MSKQEAPLTRAYWKKVGGTLIEKFLAVPQGTGHGPRLIDAVILPNQPRRMARLQYVRLGMNLMGQAFFSRELIKKFNPSSVRSVALCTKDDIILRPMAEAQGIEVVVMKRTTQP
jgi:hypothetical protein